MAAETANLESNFLSGGRAELVRIESFAFFEQVVRDRGADPRVLLRNMDIEPGVLSKRGVLIPFRKKVALLEHAAVSLKCNDFGLRLALAQRPGGVFGALDVAMRNSQTLGDAFKYCSKHLYAYCPGTLLSTGEAINGIWPLRYDILLRRLPDHFQAIESALLIIYLAVQSNSSGRARIREVWFAHQPVSAPHIYKTYFRVPVHFGTPYNAIILDSRDREFLIGDRSDQLYELATRLMEIEHPQPLNTLSEKVRSVIREKLTGGVLCHGARLHEQVANALGMHPRTLQRRLREEGKAYDLIKDDVLRETALRYLKETRLSVGEIAAALGYSEMSGLSRSCTRWFSCSPRHIRRSSTTVSEPSDDFNETRSLGVLQR